MKKAPHQGGAGDGFHRIAAAQRVDRETISADVREGGQRDALLLAATAEFDRAWRNRTQKHRAHLAADGISFEAILRAGDLGVERIATTGRIYTPHPGGFPAIIMAIWSPAPPSIYCSVEGPEILDLLALRLDKPETWWRRVGELGLVLGEDRYLEATQTSAPLKVFDSPLAWLRSGCQGSVFLDDVEGRWAAERFTEDEAALDGWWRAAS